MNKLIKFSVLNVSLFIIEVLIIFTSLVVVSVLQYGVDLFYIKGAWRDAGLWNLWRIIFFGLPFLLLYFLLFKYFENIKLYKPLLFSIFNLLAYVTFSILSSVIWGENVPLPPEGIMFWVTCLSIIFSPLILGQIPYFKKLMESF